MEVRCVVYFPSKLLKQNNRRIQNRVPRPPGIYKPISPCRETSSPYLESFCRMTVTLDGRKRCKFYVVCVFDVCALAEILCLLLPLGELPRSWDSHSSSRLPPRLGEWGQQSLKPRENEDPSSFGSNLGPRKDGHLAKGPKRRSFHHLWFLWLLLKSGPFLGCFLLAEEWKGGPLGPVLRLTTTRKRQGRTLVALQLSISSSVRPQQATVRWGSVAKVMSKRTSFLSNVITWFLS